MKVSELLPTTLARLKHWHYDHFIENTKGRSTKFPHFSRYSTAA